MEGPGPSWEGFGLSEGDISEYKKTENGVYRKILGLRSHKNNTRNSEKRHRGLTDGKQNHEKQNTILKKHTRRRE